MRIDPSTSLSTQGPKQFQVCSVCHRWYAADGLPWWDDRCGECDEARQTRSHARAHPTDGEVADGEVATEV